MKRKSPIIFLVQSSKVETDIECPLSFPDAFARKVGKLHSIIRQDDIIAQQGLSIEGELKDTSMQGIIP